MNCPAMAAIARVLELSFLLLLLLPFLAHARSNSVPELENRMYATLAGSPCVRWLNLTAELGCGNPWRTLVNAPIRRAEDTLDSPAAVLVPAGKAFREFVNRVGEDKNVVGVLVGNGSRGELGESDDVQFPQAQFAPYENRSWIWNSVGSGMMQRRFNFPVFLLSPVSGLAPVYLNFYFDINQLCLQIIGSLWLCITPEPI